MAVTDFDPSLAFVQLVGSPWTNGEYFAAIGGIEGFGGNATADLLTKPEIYEQLRGTVSAIDADNRLLTYDVRSVQEVSLSDQMRFAFAPQRKVEDLEGREIAKTEAGMIVTVTNIGIATGALVFLAAMFLIQRFVVRRRQKIQVSEEGDEL